MHKYLSIARVAADIRRYIKNSATHPRYSRGVLKSEMHSTREKIRIDILYASVIIALFEE